MSAGRAKSRRPPCAVWRRSCRSPAPSRGGRGEPWPPSLPQRRPGPGGPPWPAVAWQRPPWRRPLACLVPIPQRACGGRLLSKRWRPIPSKASAAVVAAEVAPCAPCAWSWRRSGVRSVPLDVNAREKRKWPSRRRQSAPGPPRLKPLLQQCRSPLVAPWLRSWRRRSGVVPPSRRLSRSRRRERNARASRRRPLRTEGCWLVRRVQNGVVLHLRRRWSRSGKMQKPPRGGRSRPRPLRPRRCRGSRLSSWRRTRRRSGELGLRRRLPTSWLGRQTSSRCNPWSRHWRCKRTCSAPSSASRFWRPWSWSREKHCLPPRRRRQRPCPPEGPSTCSSSETI
mmetsp:Transcript_107185/g.239334  ORF Transcript_107185/g.239334 Transcript_107185/m.239334 type:complete len:339 (-) Transcript_107185:20-1036(-)